MSHLLPLASITAVFGYYLPLVYDYVASLTI